MIVEQVHYLCHNSKMFMMTPIIITHSRQIKIKHEESKLELKSTSRFKKRVNLLNGVLINKNKN